MWLAVVLAVLVLVISLSTHDVQGGHLKVLVHNARVQNRDKNGRSDPRVQMYVSGITGFMYTSVIQNRLNPSWEELIDFGPLADIPATGVLVSTLEDRDNKVKFQHLFTLSTPFNFTGRGCLEQTRTVKQFSGNTVRFLRFTMYYTPTNRCQPPFSASCGAGARCVCLGNHEFGCVCEDEEANQQDNVHCQSEISCGTETCEGGELCEYSFGVPTGCTCGPYAYRAGGGSCVLNGTTTTTTTTTTTSTTITDTTTLTLSTTNVSVSSTSASSTESTSHSSTSVSSTSVSSTTATSTDTISNSSSSSAATTTSVGEAMVNTTATSTTMATPHNASVPSTSALPSTQTDPEGNNTATATTTPTTTTTSQGTTTAGGGHAPTVTTTTMATPPVHATTTTTTSASTTMRTPATAATDTTGVQPNQMASSSSSSQLASSSSAASTVSPSTLPPDSPAGSRAIGSSGLWTLVGVGAAVLMAVVVVLLLAYTRRRHRRAQRQPYDENQYGGIGKKMGASTAMFANPTFAGDHHYEQPTGDDGAGGNSGGDGRAGRQAINPTYAAGPSSHGFAAPPSPEYEAVDAVPFHSHQHQHQHQHQQEYDQEPASQQRYLQPVTQHGGSNYAAPAYEEPDAMDSGGDGSARHVPTEYAVPRVLDLVGGRVYLKPNTDDDDADGVYGVVDADAQPEYGTLAGIPGAVLPPSHEAHRRCGGSEPDGGDEYDYPRCVPRSEEDCRDPHAAGEDDEQQYDVPRKAPLRRRPNADAGSAHDAGSADDGDGDDDDGVYDLPRAAPKPKHNKPADVADDDYDDGDVGLDAQSGFGFEAGDDLNV
ncbi:hypothetical protein PTSG_12435 [Salpingoeca rosetta]|uniref:C2 domain-containing protein n=1 Tax=Salpingoeca rosetta (strain ATCC 50818 / BSB-021) TaxID=946362 RepID=F2UCP5_SALR5|nr:uncharacterized protein PTSG_12435 [Salpingoeca rosetta]EGD74352.1 hypothetical protein PTSG_12435 [Salpingoeca rosetta]|eukprot:XP_004993252.1 hypothetical protein PTSG_12435 [Salpingoeca rosetta]